MIDSANGAGWVRIVPIAYLVAWVICAAGYITWAFTKGKVRKRKKNGGDTPKGGAL